MRIDHASVSRNHLEFEHAGGAWQAIDQVSKNGTRLDGHPIDRAVMPGQGWLEIGAVPTRFETLQVPDEPTATRGRNSPASGCQAGAVQGVHTIDPQAIESDDSLAHAIETLAHITGCERAGLWLIGNDGGLERVAWWGTREPQPSMTAIRRAATTGSPEFCSDIAGAQALARSQSVVTGGIRALFAVPLMRDGRTMAVAYADHLRAGRLFSQHDADLLESATRQLMLILDTAVTRDMIFSLRQNLENS